MIEIKFELHTRGRIQAVSWDRCTFSNEILTFLGAKAPLGLVTVSQLVSY